MWSQYGLVWPSNLNRLDMDSRRQLVRAGILSYLLIPRSSFLVDHRSSTRTRHLTLSCAVPLAPFHVRCFLSNSDILVLCQVRWGLLFFRFPCGLPSSALLTTCHLVCSTCGRSIPRLFVLSLALSVAALFVSKAPYY